MNERPRNPRNHAASRNTSGARRPAGARKPTDRRPTVPPAKRAAGRRTPPNGRPRPSTGDRRRASSNSTPANGFARWLPVGAAGALLALVVGVGMAGGSDGGDTGPVDASVPGVPIVPASAAPTTAPVTYEPVDTVATSAPVAKTPLSKTIGDGMTGPEVRMVQTRLAELGFDPGPVDGQFGALSKQAVWAFEKLVLGTPRAEATGRVTPEMWDRMQDSIAVKPRNPTGGLGDHVEIYLPEQVMAIFHKDRPALIAHISTGELADNAGAFNLANAHEYCETITIDTDIDGNLLEEPQEKAICGKSYTPPGVFTAGRMVEGVRNGPLGGMWDPIYINQGIAIHGARNIPLQPASHGCIRVSQYLGAKLQQDYIKRGDRVLIWDGVTEPWNQSKKAMQMQWDYPDPNATTTTSTTTTTTTTTVAPTSTAAPTTTTTPPATSTTTTTTTTSPPPASVAPTTVAAPATTAAPAG